MMCNYEIISPLGEGSFGRVYKAKQLDNSKIVAYKVISKVGRSGKELKGLRKECEIQRTLEHPNIIRMLDSFETDKEIVVITEFAYKDLHFISGKRQQIAEVRVQRIVWDLVSALYYLHSHRVLHRDLKPQNILLDKNECAKLCDFGFATSMSTGTHVLTSIKGTPLYMAPELIEELPYDHKVDLWSLGCIIYELLVGATPFYTNSIIHLIRLINEKQIQWPIFLSANCTTFLQGLLNKDPVLRMSWTEIKEHPFVSGHLLIQDKEESEKPLTKSLSLNTLRDKKKQIEQYTKGKKKSVVMKLEELTSDNSPIQLTTQESDLTRKTENMTLADDKGSDTKLLTCINAANYSSIVDRESHPIENDEWMVFLKATISEVLASDFTSFGQVNLTNVLVTPLKNSNSSAKVIDLVAKLFSLPLRIAKDKTDDTIAKITKVYKDVKLVPNLVYSMTMLTRQVSDSTTTSNTSILNNQEESHETTNTSKRNADLTQDELKAIESIMLLICHLVYFDEQFLLQFCDSVLILKIYDLINQLLSLGNRRITIVADTLAIINHILKKLPENSELVDKVILYKAKDSESRVDYVSLLRNSNTLVIERVCLLLKLLKQCSVRTLERIWSNDIRHTLEPLMFHSSVIVRNTAEVVIEDLKQQAFYKSDEEIFVNK